MAQRLLRKIQFLGFLEPNFSFRSGRYIKGENLKLFEEEFAAFCNAKYAVGVSSGTAALLLSLLALEIKEGDEVIIPAHTFIATSSTAKFLGARIVYADIDPETYTVDCEDVKKKITPRTKAIIPVHLYGHPCDLAPLLELAEKYGLSIIEDACQAHGAEYKGQKVGSLGDAGCFSFFPSKNMTVLGDGGMITTNSESLAQKVSMLRDHGRTSKYLHEILGLNFRLSEVHAAIGRLQLKHLPEWISKRREIASWYNDLLPNANIILPTEKEWAKHVYHLYVIRTEQRDRLAAHLKEQGVETGIHYPVPLHRQPCVKGEYVLPVTEKYVQNILSLPVYPQLSKNEVEYIASKIKIFWEAD
jgi:dTDP-4-amino-4,6-dideoxygalactose transaminase